MTHPLSRRITDVLDLAPDVPRHRVRRPLVDVG